MDRTVIVIVCFAVAAVLLGYIGLEWSATAGHWNDAGNNWSR